MNILERLTKKELIKPPTWLPVNTHYLVMMGSIAYGVSADESDTDVYGFAIPPKDMVFPHLRGEIPGFGKQVNRFEQFQQHHVEDKEARKQYDLQVYSIVKYFQLVMQNNPNMIDSLFVPQRCVLHSTRIGNLVRDNRKIFLHKGAWHTFKGYSYSQMHKAETKNPIGRRKETIEKYGMDTKFLYHVVRLLNEVEMILTEGDLDLERNREQLKAIRRGEWTIDQIKDYFTSKERELETVYTSSKLPHGPDENEIKRLLLSCLEDHYGSLEKVLPRQGNYDKMVSELRELIQRYGG